MGLLTFLRADYKRLGMTLQLKKKIEVVNVFNTTYFSHFITDG